MQERYLSDPEFIKKLDENFKRVHAIAKAEERDVLEVIESDISKHFDNIGVLISEGMDSLKKAHPREKYKVLNVFEKLCFIAENLKSNNFVYFMQDASMRINDTEAIAA
ncbi:MAG: hypothetical protein FWE27_00845 [Defluviitaleaceae bacterium]|nr:hypothetical protein [Defluviitaleaceae bacterium]